MQTLKELPVATVWTVVLALGGLQLLVFFATVGFVPNLDLKAAASLLAATALLGAGLVAAIAVMFALPSIMLASTSPAPVGNRQIVRHLLESAIGVMGMPMWMTIALMQLPTADLENGGWHLFGQVLFAVTLLGSYAYVVRVGYRSEAKSSGIKRVDDFVNAVFRLFLWFAWSACVGFINSLLLKTGGMGVFYITYFVFPLVVALFSIILFAFTDKGRWVKIAALGLCSAVLHSVFVGQPSWFIDATIEKLGYSYGPQVLRVVLTESGCAIVNVALGVSAPTQDSSSNRETKCVLDPTTKMGVVYARITSRIGSPYVLEIPEQKAGKQPADKTGATKAVGTRRVLVKADDVLTWLFEPPPIRIPVPANK